MANKQPQIKQITVAQMYKALGTAIKQGFGNRYLIASNDNEGNGYHGVFFTVTHIDAGDGVVELLSDSQVTDPDKLVIIG